MILRVQLKISIPSLEVLANKSKKHHKQEVMLLILLILAAPKPKTLLKEETNHSQNVAKGEVILTAAVVALTFRIICWMRMLRKLLLTQLLESTNKLIKSLETLFLRRYQKL